VSRPTVKVVAVSLRSVKPVPSTLNFTLPLVAPKPPATVAITVADALFRMTPPVKVLAPLKVYVPVPLTLTALAVVVNAPTVTVGVLPARSRIPAVPANAPEIEAALVPVPLLKVTVRVLPPVLNPPDIVKVPVALPLPLMVNMGSPETVAAPESVRP